MQAREGYSHGYAAEKGSAERDIRDSAEIRAADSVQVGENNADNKSSFHAFAQSYRKGFQHIS